MQKLKVALLLLNILILLNTYQFLTDLRTERGSVSVSTPGVRNYVISASLNVLISFALYLQLKNSKKRKEEMRKAKGEFLSIASHELRTPLTSLTGYIYILRKRIQKSYDPESDRLIGKIEFQLLRITTLVAELLELSRLESGKMKMMKESIDMNLLIFRVVNNVKDIYAGRKISIEGRVNRKVKADKKQIEVALTHLLTNAVKFSSDGSKITVRIHEGGKNILTMIKDEGIGIPVNFQQHIFERFFQVEKDKRKDDPSLGLGLYLSKEIITRHGGSIWFESKEGSGSVFYFTLP